MRVFLAYLFAVLCIMSIPVWSQTEEEPSDFVHMKNSEGTDFWLCFMKNYKEGSDPANNDQLTLELFFTANETSEVTVEIEGLRYRRTLIVSGGTVSTLMIDERAQLSSSKTPQKLAVHVSSDFPISVYGLNRRFQTTDTYLALPVGVLGKEYRAVCYNMLSQELISQVAVVATEDETELTVVPRTPALGGREAGKPYVVKMNRGEVYQVIADFGAMGLGDLTGTLLSANKKISVFSGHSCAYVPSGIAACNHLVEQLPPVSAWGKHFYVGMFKGRSRYTLRVVAHENHTKVFEDSRLVSVLSAGEFYENLNVRKSVQITADRPVLVAQYSQGFKNGDSIGDPMMILISPTQQFVKRYRIATPVNGQWDHFMNIVVPTNKISSLRLDGKALPLSQFETLGLSRYSLAQIKVDFGTHVVYGDVPFGLYLYGFGYGNDSFDAYGNMGGQSFFDLDYSRDTLPPIGETQAMRGGTSLIIRDDRNSDRGIKSIHILTAQGMTTALPTVEEGIPQVVLTIRPTAENSDAKMVVRAIDGAGNAATYTICYSRDAKSNAYGYRLCPEGQECGSISKWSASAFLMYSSTFHSADFSSAGNVVANGSFGDAFGGGGYFGVSATRHLNSSLSLTGGLSIESIGGTLLAPDSSILHIRDSNGVLQNFQEERMLSISSPMLCLRIVAEYSLLKNLYVLGGAKAMFLVSDGVEYKRHIILPQDQIYPDVNSAYRDIPIEGMSALGTLRMALVAGAGFSVPIKSHLSAYVEAELNQPLSGLINVSNGSWSTWSFLVHLGARMSF